jgi:phage-related protein
VFAAAWQGLVTVVTSVWQAILGILNGDSLVDVGRNLLMGLVSGITGAVSAVVDAVKNAVGAAIGAAKSVLGISSPSKEFATLGDLTGQGFAGGVEGTTADAQAALADLVAPPDAPAVGLGGVAASVSSPADGASGGASSGASGGAAAGGSSAGGGLSVSFAGAVFNFSVADGTDAADKLGARLTDLLEGDAAQIGGEVST